MLCYAGVDVGTASVRAGLYSLSSKSFQNIAVHPITVHKAVVNVKDADHTEIISQSSTEIWTAVCITVQKVIKDVDTASVRGIGFDATCSLVIIGPDDKPMEVDGTIHSSLEGRTSYLDVIMWQDHRAKYYIPRPILSQGTIHVFDIIYLSILFQKRNRIY